MSYSKTSAMKTLAKIEKVVLRKSYYCEMSQVPKRWLGGIENAVCESPSMIRSEDNLQRIRDVFLRRISAKIERKSETKL